LGKNIKIKFYEKVATHDQTGLNVAIKIINKKKMKNSKMCTKVNLQFHLLLDIRYFNTYFLFRLKGKSDSCNTLTIPILSNYTRYLSN
jgi:hypothetical protein